MMRTVLGVFSNQADADSAIDDLDSAGYQAKDISILMQDKGDARMFAKDTGTNVADSAVSGAVTGGVIGGIAGLLIGIGAIAIPGIGAVLIGGPLAAALGATGAAATTVSGAATGLLAGGLIGALVGLGVPEDDARVYEERIRNGGILVAIPAQEGEEDEVRAILEDNGAGQIRAFDTPLVQEAMADEEEYIPDVTTSRQYAYAGTKGGKSKVKKTGKGRVVRKHKKTIAKD